MEPVFDADLTGSDVGNHLRNEERTELRSVLLVGTEILHLVLKRANTSDTYTVDNTDLVLVDLLQVHATIGNSLVGCNDGQLCVTVHLAGLLAVNILCDVKVFHLTGEMSLALRAIKLCNRGSSAHAVQKVLPCFLGCITERRNGTDTCYYYSF